jgi:hydrogenase expression/formation protein HypC
MGVAFPAEILSIDGAEAEVSIGGTRRRASICLTPEVRIGDFVLLHVGFAIRVLDLAEARATIDLLKEMSDSNG